MYVCIFLNKIYLKISYYKYHFFIIIITLYYKKTFYVFVNISTLLTFSITKNTYHTYQYLSLISL